MSLEPMSYFEIVDALAARIRRAERRGQASPPATVDPVALHAYADTLNDAFDADWYHAAAVQLAAYGRPSDDEIVTSWRAGNVRQRAMTLLTGWSYDEVMARSSTAISVIVRTPDVFSGAPRFRGTRCAPGVLFENLAIQRLGLMNHLFDQDLTS